MEKFLRRNEQNFSSFIKAGSFSLALTNANWPPWKCGAQLIRISFNFLHMLGFRESFAKKGKVNEIEIV